MAYDRQSILISWLFDILGEDEVAVTSLHVSGTTSFDASAALGGVSGADLISLQGAMTTLMSNSDLQWGNFSRETGIKLAALDTSGHYLEEPLVADIGSPASGSSTGNVFPQDTVVVSLRSPSTFGQANRGRMYLPHCCINRVTATPFMNGTAIAAVATAAQVFLNAVNDVMNTGSDPAIIQIMSSKGTGAAKAVTTCAIGNVLDTQRRRRNRLVEQYTSRAVSS